MNISFPDATSSGAKVESQRSSRTPSSSSSQQTVDTGTVQDAVVSLSDTGVQALRAQLTNVPDVRQERVQSLRNAFEKGTYNPSSQQIAEAIHADLFGASSNSAY